MKKFIVDIIFIIAILLILVLSLDKIAVLPIIANESYFRATVVALLAIIIGIIIGYDT